MALSLAPFEQSWLGRKPEQIWIQLSQRLPLHAHDT